MGWKVSLLLLLLCMTFCVCYYIYFTIHMEDARETITIC